MEPSPTRNHASTTAAAPASTNFASKVRFPGDDGGHSLAEMARRDLDAALQLLADRAQYITGASGAAIALRRKGKKDMLCRASTGSNAPELGALLSTEFGLSGESVRTRQPLRCDDAERDVRVNRQVCRQLGIASVVVMPVVNDDEVLGVFELFSGEVNAFGERDLSAVQRLSEMVETAVRLADAAENLPERLAKTDVSAPNAVPPDKVLSGQVLEELVLEDAILGEVVSEELILEEARPEPGFEIAADGGAKKEGLVNLAAEPVAGNIAGVAHTPLKSEIPVGSTSSEPALSQEVAEEAAVVDKAVAAAPEPPKDTVTESAVAISSVAPPKAVAAENIPVEPQAGSPGATPMPAPSIETAPSRRQLFWSVALNSAGDAAKPEEDQSHVPPLLRNLRKCEACGFPVSTGRVLCVECEEKKWRGQLGVPKAGATRPMATPAAGAHGADGADGAEGRAFAAAAQSVAGTAAAAPVPVASTAFGAGQLSPAALQRTESKPAAQTALPPALTADPPGTKTASKSSVRTQEVRPPDFVLSAGLEPSESWLEANKYVIGVLLIVAIAVAAFVLLR